MILNICFIILTITLIIFSILVLVNCSNMHTDIVERQIDIDNKLEALLDLFKKDEESEETEENEENKESEESKEDKTIFGLVDDLLSGKRSMEDDSE